MLRTPETILSTLTAHASQFRFPLVADPRVAPLAGRLRCFALDNRWAIAFEWLVFSEAELAFPLDLYVYGSLAGPESFTLQQAEGFALDPDTWSAKSEWDPGPVVMLRVGNSRIHARNDALDTAAIRISHGDLSSEVTFGRAVVREVGLHTLIPDGVLLGMVPELRNATEVVRFSDWDHPDLTAGETPRDSRALVACAKLLSDLNSSLDYDHSHDNVRAALLRHRLRT